MIQTIKTNSNTLTITSPATTPTITLGNNSSLLANVITGKWNYAANVYDPLMSMVSPAFKKYEINESVEDLLVLSSVAYRLRKENSLKSGLLSNHLVDNITTEDVLLANQIREFYQQKFLIWKLKDKVLTPYRKDLSDFIHSEGKKFIDKMVPLAYRLPEMYHYDKKLDEVRGEFTNIDIPIRVANTILTKFTTVLRLERTSTGKKRIDYWMKDSQGYPYKFTLSAEDPILSLWEKEFNNAHIEMRVKSKLNRIDDLAFFSIQQILETV